MTKVGGNYLNRIKQYIPYDEILQLLMQLIQLMIIDQENGIKHSYDIFEPHSDSHMIDYFFIKKDNGFEIRRNKLRGMELDKLLQIHFNLWPIDATENAQWGSINIRIVIDKHLSIILSKRFDKILFKKFTKISEIEISDLLAAQNFRVIDLKRINPVLVVSYDKDSCGKDYYRVFDLVTENFVGYQGGNVNFNLNDGEVVIDNYVLLSDGESLATFKPEDNDDSSKGNMGNKNASIGASEDSGILPFLQEVDRAREILTSDEIKKYIFDANELAYLASCAADHFAEYGKKSNSSDRRIRKFIGLFPSGKNI